MATPTPPAGTPTSEPNKTKGDYPFPPLVCVVDFHHARGPEVEQWFGVADGSDPAAENNWQLLPFMALSDGAHASTEDFSYFTLLKPETPTCPATSLFGISCTRQMDASQLLNRPSDVTRSTVQKAVVVIADSPQFFAMLRERLSVVTTAWFAQREFTDVEILRRFQESLADEKSRGKLNDEVDRDQYLGLNLRELVREFKWQTLVLLKCCLLQPKMLFFGSRCEKLCMMQFSFVSLIPGLLRNLQDCAGPELNNYEKKLSKPTSLRTSDRSSLLAYMGLPLQIFGKGSLFGPYTPLQQLDILADYGTKSYIVGSTNSLLLQQRDRYSDILINLDDGSINITSPSLKAALQLSHSDRRWIDFITQEVNDTWDETNPGRPKTMGYVGSEEFIRLQFEEYLLSLISSVKYHNNLVKHGNNPKMTLPHVEGDPSHDFATDFVEAWMRTENYRLWATNTDTHLFDIVEPRHPCAGGLNIDDIQRRFAQQVQELRLDERFAQGKEVLGSTLAAGKERASTMLNKLYADMEGLRESQRRKAEEARLLQQDRERGAARGGVPPTPTTPHPRGGGGHERSGSTFSAVDLSKAGQTMQSVGVKAGAFVSSWAAWAGEKRRGSGWGVKSPLIGGWGGSTGSKRGGQAGNRNTMSSTTSDASSDRDMQLSRTMSMSSTMTGASDTNNEKAPRPLTQTSFGESVLDGAPSESDAASLRSRPMSGESTTAPRGIETVMAAPVRNGAGSPPKTDGDVKIPTVEEGEEDEVPIKAAPKRQSVVNAVGSKVMLRP